METIQSPWMNEQNVVQPYNAIVFDHKKEWSTDMCYIMYKPWKYCAKWKKDTKGYILYDSISMVCPA